MDVHRCRFVPYQPSAINAIAFSHPKPRTNKHNILCRMAVGRANGDIEIWNPSKGSWNQELVIRGGKDRSVEGLVWVSEPDQDLGEGRILLGKSRLFSIGYTSTITEWDLETGKPRRHASGQHGHIWCIAAQPQSDASAKSANGAVHEPVQSSKLLCGTIDGELVMYSTEDDDLRMQRVIVRSPSKKANMVSITFQSRKIAVVGCSDSTIRAYDVTKGHMIRRMTLGSDLIGGSKEIIVWAVQCLPNGNIVSGDSTGQLCIWDGKTYTQMQRIQSHKQDILSLAASADGTSILSGGMDRRTVLYKQSAGAGHRWSKVSGRRYHEHDVKALSSFESGNISVVVSGGTDSNTVVVPLKEMTRENHRTLPNLPQQPPMASAPNARFVISWWEREVHIWVIRKPVAALFDSEEIDVDSQADLNRNRKLLKTIVVKGDSNISSATINADGTLLIVSTTTDVKAFRLEHQAPMKPSDVKTSTLELPQKLTKFGASQVQLSADGSWLCLVHDGLRAMTANIETTEKGAIVRPESVRRLARLKRHIPKHVQNGGHGKYERNITHIAFSPDSSMLAVADLAGYVDTWTLSSQQGKIQNSDAAEQEEASSDSESDASDSDEESVAEGVETWVRNPNGKLLPKLPSAPAVLAFSDDVPTAKDDDYTLLAITRSWHMHVFHPKQGALTPWSRRHPRKSLPAPILDLIDPPKGVFWQGSRAWIYGVTFLLMLDLSLDLPKPTEAAETTGDQVGLKRKRTGHGTGAGGKMAQGNLKPQQITKHIDGQEEDIDMDDVRTGDESNSDDEMDDASDELAQLRNAKTNGNQNAGMVVAEAGTDRKSWWMTFKYRPILGAVPLGQEEIAVVERPLWDIDMPERYVTGEEWEQ